MYQVAFGQLGLDRQTFEWMETRDFLNAWIGHLDQKQKDYAVLFETVKFGSYYNVFSNEQAKALKRSRNPYVDTKPKRASNENIGRMLSALANAFNDQK